MNPSDFSAHEELTGLDEVLAEYMERLDNGEVVDRERFLADHADVAEELRDYFRTTEDVARLGAATTPADTRALRDYELLEEVARGGMGVVYRARQVSLNRIVALKMILAGQLASAADVQRFRLEAEAAAGLRHPNIVQIYEVGEDEGRHFFSMEFVEGGSLAKRLGEFVGDAGKAAGLMATVAEAVHHAHQHGILHRDLKPANVLLAADGSPKVTDFGLAKRFHDDSDLTPTGEIVGTPRYMAPEQASGQARHLTVAADVYSLGAILYELLTGQPPFLGQTPLETLLQVQSQEPVPPSRVVKAVPRDLETIALKCLTKEPSRRYGSAQEMADDLRRFLNNEPIHARPSGLWTRGVKWARRRPAYAVLAASACVGLLVLAVWGTKEFLDMRAALAAQIAKVTKARKEGAGMYEAATIWFEDSPSGQLDDHQRKFLQQAVNLFEGTREGQADDPILVEEIALSSFQLGQIQRLLEHHGDSEAAYRQAVDLQERLSTTVPGEPRNRQQLARSLTWLGDLLRLGGERLSEAEKCFRDAARLQTDLTNQSPGDQQYRRELARSWYNLGIVEMDTGRDQDALRDFNTAVEALELLLASPQGTPADRHELARCSINRAVLHRSAGRFTEARDDYLRAVNLLRGLKEEFSNRAVYKLELAVASNNLGNLLVASDLEADRASAPGRLEEARVLAQGLVEWFPGRPQYRKELANIHNSLGAVGIAAGDGESAGKHWERGLAEYRRLTEQFPAVADYHGGHGRTAGNLGLLYGRRGEWEKARPLFEEAVSHLRAALVHNPNHPDDRRHLHTNRQSRAETLVQLKDHAAAAAAAHELADGEPADPMAVYFAACFLARCVPLTDDDQLAEKYAVQAIEMLRRAVRAGFHNAMRLEMDGKEMFKPLRRRQDFLEIVRDLKKP